jgi:dihydroneopterin aldolase
MSITVEVHGLRLFSRHGVLEEERREGQEFIFDVDYNVPDDVAAADRIEDAVDYREVAACVREVSAAQDFDLLEALAAAVADAIRDRFPVERVRVRVRKPGIRLDPPASYAAATVERC